MKYTAMIFDLDGTIVPFQPDGMPSENVIKAVLSLHKKMKLSTASGRSLITCRNIWKALSLSDPCIINGGSQIINPTTEKILWEQKLPEGTVEKVVSIAKQYTDQFAINGTIMNVKNDREKFPKNANIVVAFGVKKENGEQLFKKLTEITDITVHLLGSWVQGDYCDIHITHHLATKKHAVEKLMEITQLKKERVIGVGDGSNDMPIFESVGYKVAMGNATDELKNAADYITDSFENDGFAKFIEEKLPEINK